MFLAYVRSNQVQDGQRGSEEVRRRVGVREEMSDRKGWKVLKRFEHVGRISEERLSARVYKSELEGRADSSG